MKTAIVLVSVAMTSAPLCVQAQSGSSERGGGNDECATAISVVVSSDCAGSIAAYDATSATESQAAIVCNELVSPQANDLWYSFVAISAATAVQVEGTASFDPVIEVFSGSCGALLTLGCADLTYPQGAPPQNSMESLQLATDIGSTYFIRIYSYWNPAPTDFGFTLCVFSVNDPPANDLCSAVVTVPLEPGSPLTLVGDDTDALDTEGLGRASVWYAFVIGECANVSIDLCGTAPARTSPYTGLFTDCTLGTRIISNGMDQAGCPDGNTTLLFENLAAGTYFYPVMRDPNAGSGGPFILNLNSVIPSAYCATNTIECDEYIARVVIGGIDNVTDCTPGAAADHTAISTGIERTQSLLLTVFNGPVSYGEDSVAAWVDWDQDLAFCGPEEHFSMTSADDGVTYTGMVTAPIDAELGTTRLRIRMVYDEVPVACGGSEFGEVEDYSLEVRLITGIRNSIGTEWSVYPNPGNGDFVIRSAHTSGPIVDGKVLVEVIDATGRILLQQQRTGPVDSPFIVKGSDILRPGIHVLRFSTMAGTWTQRLVVR